MFGLRQPSDKALRNYEESYHMKFLEFLVQVWLKVDKWHIYRRFCVIPPQRATRWYTHLNGVRNAASACLHTHRPHAFLTLSISTPLTLSLCLCHSLRNCYKSTDTLYTCDYCTVCLYHPNVLFCLDDSYFFNSWSYTGEGRAISDV